MYMYKYIAIFLPSQWGATPLEDNLPTDNYHYQITVQTGMRKKAGTTSKISFVLSGESNDSGARRLYDGHRKVGRSKSHLNILLYHGIVYIYYSYYELAIFFNFLVVTSI